MIDTELSSKLPRVAQNPKLEKAFSTWVVQCQTRNVALTGEIIKVKAKVLSERLHLPEGTIKFSSGWLQRLQKRDKLRSIGIHGESVSANEKVMGESFPSLRAVIARYEPQDVFNMDETDMSRFEKS